MQVVKKFSLSLELDEDEAGTIYHALRAGARSSPPGVDGGIAANLVSMLEEVLQGSSGSTSKTSGGSPVTSGKGRPSRVSDFVPEVEEHAELYARQQAGNVGRRQSGPPIQDASQLIARKTYSGKGSEGISPSSGSDPEEFFFSSGEEEDPEFNALLEAELAIAQE